MAHVQLASLFQKVAEKKRIEVVTAVCKISRNCGKKRSVGQGCLVQTKQSHECCVVTTAEVIPHGQLDTCWVEFTKNDSKRKRFFLKDITKEVKCDSGLVKIVIDLKSSKLKHGNNTCSIFTESPLTITALEESKKQFCCVDRKIYNLQVNNDNTIEFPDGPPSAICDGLIILQTSNSTDDDVTAVGIQRQVDGNQKMTILASTSTRTPPSGDDQHSLAGGAAAVADQPDNEHQNPVLNGGTAADSLTAPSTTQDRASINEPQNPGTACTQTPANGDGQQLLPATDPPDNEPQNPVLNSGTAAGDVTDVSHTSSTNNEDAAEHTALVTGDAYHNSQRSEGASLLGHINGGFPEQENGPTNHSFQEESEHGATGGTSDQQDGTVTENFEHYLVSDKIRRNVDLQNMFASNLDKTSHRMIKNWESLASTTVIDAPLEVYLKCKLNGQNSCTQMLFEQLVSDVKYKDKKVRHLRDALTEINGQARKLIEDSPAYQEDAENCLDKKIREFADYELINSLATYLDQKSMVHTKPFWYRLGAQLHVTKENLEEIWYCQVNSTKAVMDYYYSKHPKATIGQFYDVVETKLRRDDVLEILKPIEARGRGEKLQEVLGLESDEMTRICVLFNKPIPGVKNWKHLAKELGIAKNIYEDFRPDNPDSPTKVLFNWIFDLKEDLTVGQLISALRSIDRNDVVEKLRQHFLQHSTTD